MALRHIRNEVVDLTDALHERLHGHKSRFLDLAESLLRIDSAIALDFIEKEDLNGSIPVHGCI